MRETRCLDRLKKLYPLAHWQTISGLAQGGVFDCNGCFNGCEVWVEFKQADRPRTDRGLIKPSVQPGQPGWQAARAAAGGRTFVALMLDSYFYLLPGWCIRELRDGISLSRLKELELDPACIFDKEKSVNGRSSQRPDL